VSQTRRQEAEEKGLDMQFLLNERLQVNTDTLRVSNPASVLNPNENVDMIVEYELQEAGSHTLRVSVNYIEASLSGFRHPLDGTDTTEKAPKSVRKFYRFNVLEPLLVEAKLFQLPQKHIDKDAPIGLCCLRIQNIMKQRCFLDEIILEKVVENDTIPCRVTEIKLHASIKEKDFAVDFRQCPSQLFKDIPITTKIIDTQNDYLRIMADTRLVSHLLTLDLESVLGWNSLSDAEPYLEAQKSTFRAFFVYGKSTNLRTAIRWTAEAGELGLVRGSNQLEWLPLPEPFADLGKNAYEHKRLLNIAQRVLTSPKQDSFLKIQPINFPAECCVGDILNVEFLVQVADCIRLQLEFREPCLSGLRLVGLSRKNLGFISQQISTCFSFLAIESGFHPIPSCVGLDLDSAREFPLALFSAILVRPIKTDQVFMARRVDSAATNIQPFPTQQLSPPLSKQDSSSSLTAVNNALDVFSQSQQLSSSDSPFDKQLTPAPLSNSKLMNTAPPSSSSSLAGTGESMNTDDDDEQAPAISSSSPVPPPPASSSLAPQFADPLLYNTTPTPPLPPAEG